MPGSEEKWALITGVSEGGLGDALTRELLKRKINVIATALNLEHLEYFNLPSDTIPRLEKLQLDVTNEHSITSAVQQSQAISGGRLHYLFNNAGYGYMMPLLDCSVVEVKRNFDVNVFGLLAVTQAFFPMLREAKGTVVNQSSIAGLWNTYQASIGSYTASKSAVCKLSDTMRVELAPFGVQVVTLVTGDVGTHFWDNAVGSHVGLPTSSLYMPIKDKVEAMMQGKTNPPGQHSPERWAKDVVSDLLRRPVNAPSYIRRGYLAKTMWLLGWLAPYWALDWMYWKVAELDKLRRVVSEGEKESRKDR